MKLRPTDLPIKVRQAYEASAIEPSEALSLEKFGALAEIEAVAVVDNPNGVIYTTRDSGQSFEVEAIAETIHLRGDPSANEGVVVRRVVRILKIAPAGSPCLGGERGG